MTITEASRKRLYDRLEAALGREEADTLMEHLPPVGWSEVARQSDVDRLHTATRTDFDRAEVATGREFNLLRAEMSSEFAAVRAEMSSEFAAVRAEIGHLNQQFSSRLNEGLALVRVDLMREIRTFGLAMFGLNFTVIASALAILKF